MNFEALFLFLILLLGLVLCSFLGGNCQKEGMTGNFTGSFQINGNDMSGNSYSGASTGSSTQYDNYNHYSGSSTQLAPGTYYGPNGGTVVVSTNSNGTQSLQVTLASGQTSQTYTTTQPSTSSTSSTSSTDASGSTTDASGSTVESYTNYYGTNGTATVFYGPSGNTATVVQGSNGQNAIQVKTTSGTYTFTQNGSYYNPENTTNTQYYGSTGYPLQSSSYSTAYGGSAGSVTGPQGNTAYYAQGPNGTTVTGNTVTGTNTYTPYYNGTSSTQYYGPYGGSAGSVTGPQGNTAYYAQGPQGNTVAGTTTSSSNYNYYSTLPPGVPASAIPPGQEDLYILKSEIVPPVCPVCPAAVTNPAKTCPPCEPCGRCPEPAFDCKKVPNYSALDNRYLPQPVLNDFSTFGM